MRSWRNQKTNREVSIEQHEISGDEHLAWWGRVQHDDTRRVLIFEVDGRPRGVVNFFGLSLGESPKSGSWGFFLDHDSLAADGTAMMAWVKVMDEAVGFAFDELGLDVLQGEVLAHNEPVRMMNRRFRFEEGTPTERESDGRTISVIPVSLRREDRRTRGRRT